MKDLGFPNIKDNFSMEIASDTGLEFLDLELKIIEVKIKVDVFAKPVEGKGYET